MHVSVFFNGFNLDPGVAPAQPVYDRISDISIEEPGAGVTWTSYSLDVSYAPDLTFQVDDAAVVALDSTSSGWQDIAASNRPDTAGDTAGDTGPSCLIEVGGQSFVVLGDAGTSSIAVHAVEEDGQTGEMTDQVIDTLQTRFSGVTMIESVQVGDQTLVLAAGTDNGLSVFSLQEGGRLHHVETVEGSWARPLDSIETIVTTAQDGTLSLSLTRAAPPHEMEIDIDIQNLQGAWTDAGPAAQVAGAEGADNVIWLDDGAGNDATVQTLYALGQDGPEPARSGASVDFDGMEMNWAPGVDGKGMVLELFSEESEFRFKPTPQEMMNAVEGVHQDGGQHPLPAAGGSWSHGEDAHHYDGARDFDGEYGADHDDMGGDMGGSWIIEAQMFAAGHDTVRIVGFRAEDEGDAIDLSRLGGFEAPEDVIEAATDTADGVLIATGHEGGILIEGVTLTDLSADDFIT